MKNNLFKPEQIAAILRQQELGNAFSTAASTNNADWDTSTGLTPWWATLYANNKCDDIFADGFDD